MSEFYFNATKEKYKNVSPLQIETTIIEVDRFEAAHKGQKRNTSKTRFIQDLADQTGCSPATVYRVLRNAQIQAISGSTLETHIEQSASAAVGKRELQKKKLSQSKAKSARPFPDQIVHKLKKTSWLLSMSRFTGIKIEQIHFIHHIIKQQPNFLMERCRCPRRTLRRKIKNHYFYSFSIFCK